MQYKEQIVEGIFVSRPNRFIAYVLVQGKQTVVHVPNTGRCRELLIKDCTVFLKKNSNPLRKTAYDLIAVKKHTDCGDILINMDSLAPNKVASEWITSRKDLFYEVTYIKSEYTFGDSRFDYYFEYKDIKGCSHRMLLEVKGVTLENNGTAMFPDAPTLRGVKHINGLSDISREGLFECGILFVIQMQGCSLFTSNGITHPEFAEGLKNAQKSGVRIFASDCKVTPDSLVYDKDIPVLL